MRFQMYRAVVVFAALALAAVFAPSAGAVVLVGYGGRDVSQLQAWADEARVPTPNTRVLVFMPGSLGNYDPCGGAAACASRGDISLMNIYALRPSIFFHELGHVYDYSMPEWKRREFYSITGYGPNWTAGPNSAAERFADAYSLCARDVRGVGKRWSRNGRVYFGRWGGGRYSPRSPQVHHAVCRLIRA